MNKKPEIEEWQFIPDFEDYEISNWGRLKLKPSYDDPNIRSRGIKLGAARKRKGEVISKAKSHEICLRKDGQGYWFKRGQLVLLAFVGPPPSDKERNARHLNDNPEQNWVTNLAWGTHKDNHDDGVKNGRHSKKGTQEALRYGAPLKGKARPDEVKKKISATKRQFPDRQFYGGKKDSKKGRFVS